MDVDHDKMRSGKAIHPTRHRIVLHALEFVSGWKCQAAFSPSLESVACIPRLHQLIMLCQGIQFTQLQLLPHLNVNIQGWELNFHLVDKN